MKYVTGTWILKQHPLRFPFLHIFIFDQNFYFSPRFQLFRFDKKFYHHFKFVL